MANVLKKMLSAVQLRKNTARLSSAAFNYVNQWRTQKVSEGEAKVS